MKTLHIQNNTIINISNGEPESSPPDGTEYLAVADGLYVGVGWVKDGENWADPNPPVIPGPQATTEIDARRAKLALNQMGLYTTVQSTIEAMDIPAQINWKDATIWRKDDPLVQSIATGLGLAEADITELFELAATLT